MREACCSCEGLEKLQLREECEGGQVLLKLRLGPLDVSYPFFLSLHDTGGGGGGGGNDDFRGKQAAQRQVDYETFGATSVRRGGRGGYRGRGGRGRVS